MLLVLILVNNGVFFYFDIDRFTCISSKAAIGVYSIEWRQFQTIKCFLGSSSFQNPHERTKTKNKTFYCLHYSCCRSIKTTTYSIHGRFTSHTFPDSYSIFNQLSGSLILLYAHRLKILCHVTMNCSRRNQPIFAELWKGNYLKGSDVRKVRVLIVTVARISIDLKIN